MRKQGHPCRFGRTSAATKEPSTGCTAHRQILALAVALDFYAFDGVGRPRAGGQVLDFFTAVIRSAVPHNHPGAPTAPDALTVDVIGSTTNPCISD